MNETTQFDNHAFGENASAPMPPKPDNYLILAIFSTACCCLPIGIYAIILASKVNTYYFAKQYDLAVMTANDAKKWSLISIVAGILGGFGYAGIFGLGYLGILD